ncbi:MAG: NUDIX domain-containing protein [Pseudomonadota bacterium]
MSVTVERNGRTLWPCVSFLLVQDNRILLETRRLDKASDPGLVAVPGGHMEPGEDEGATLARELEEELGVRALASHYVCSLLHPTTTELQWIHYHAVTAWSGEIQALEAARVDFHPLDGPLPIDVAADRVAVAEWLRLRDQIRTDAS